MKRGFTATNLRYMRQFYLAFPNHHALRDDSESTTLRPELSWTHYRLLLGVEDPQAREWYMREAADQFWEARETGTNLSSRVDGQSNPFDRE